MALIARFEHRPLTPHRIHGEVLCGYNATQIGQRQILQLEPMALQIARFLERRVSRSKSTNQVLAS